MDLYNNNNKISLKKDDLKCIECNSIKKENILNYRYSCIW